MTDSAKPTLMVIDGHSLAFRAFFALPLENFTTKDQQHTNAVYGFLSMLINLIKTEAPTHLVVAFDVGLESFRTREYPAYKATRTETPMEFRGQVTLLQECLAAMSIPVLTMEDFEADDILATLAKTASDDGFDVLVVSGDRDAIQLVNDQVTLLYPSVQGVSQLKRYDPAAVKERYGVDPQQYPDVAALVGETSDNLPGVPKVGEKTAVKWLTRFGTLDELLTRADEVTGVVGGNLREHLDDVRRNRRLNALRQDLELPLTPGEMARAPIDEPALREVFARLEFRSLLGRVFEAVGEGHIESEVALKAPEIAQTTPAELLTWVNSQSDEVAVTVVIADGLPTELGVATLNEIHQAEWTPELAQALDGWLRGSSAKILADAKPQLKALARSNIRLGGLAFDVIIAGWLIRPSFPDKTLAHLVTRCLDEKLPEADPNQLVPEHEGASAGLQAWYTIRVAEVLRSELGSGPESVLLDIELPTVSVLADLELAGVAVSREVLDGFATELATRAGDIAAQAYAQIGREVNLSSPKQLQEVLFEQLELPKTRKTKTGYSTDASALTDLQETNPHPFLGLLLSHREVTKLRQIIETLTTAIQPDNRIHTTYVQTGSQTGRLSSADPNLQNIPVRTVESRRIRSAFAVGEGFTDLLTADYSQIEMRVMAHLSQDAGLIAAFHAGEDLHSFVGAQVFQVDPQDVTSQMRSKVKAMSYGLVYGLSAFGLSKQLRIEQSEAKDLMVQYFARFGAVRDYLRSSVEAARELGYTETIFGRRRPFPELKSTNRMLRENAERAALNAPIQGSAADIMKIALNRIHHDLRERGLKSRALLQIHDELVLEVAGGEWDEVEETVRGRMGSAADLLVPLDVQVGRGKNWDEAAH